MEIGSILMLGGALAASCGGNKPSVTPKEPLMPEHPNFLVVTVHDIGYYDFGYTGSDFYETPNVDYLASQGIHFASHYGCGPNSSPSRAAMLTGRFSPYNNIYSTGFTGTESKMRLKQWTKNITLSPDSYTIAEALHDSGYATGFVGDWDPLDPTYQGFDIVREDKAATSGTEGASTDPKKLVTDVAYTKDVLNQLSASGKPFFALVNLNAIHTPLQSSKAYLDYFNAKTPGTKHKRADYAACIKSMDDAVGEIVSHLQDMGLEDNTIVIFSGDHGAVFYSDQSPDRGFKGMSYNGAYHIPFIVYCPKYIKPSKCEMPTAGVDVFPTLMNLAGASYTNPVDGISLRDILCGNPAPQLRPTPLYWHMPGYLSIGNYKNAGARDETFRTRPNSVVRDGDWKLILYYEEWLLDGGWDKRETNNSIELYDLSTDVSESRNLAGEQPEVRDRLLRQLLDWLETSKAPIPEVK